MKANKAKIILYLRIASRYMKKIVAGHDIHFYMIDIALHVYSSHSLKVTLKIKSMEKQEYEDRNLSTSPPPMFLI